MPKIEKADDAQRDSLFKVSDSFEKFSPVGRVLMDKIDSSTRAIYNYQLDRVDSGVDEAGLALLYTIINRGARNSSSSNIDMERAGSIFVCNYKDSFSSNLMANKISIALDALNVKQGNKFIDFTLPCAMGNEYTLSSLIKGKVAVIDLWASWCGPCMRTSVSFIPVWEKYHSKGFEIVGVARERDNTKAMEKAIARLKLPWINLVELYDGGNIWAKYGAGNSGGKVILVDSTGTIIAEDFTAEELTTHLQRLWGE